MMNFLLYNHAFADEEENVRLARRPRIFLPWINFDRDFINTKQRFQLTPQHVQLLVERIGPFIEHGSDVNCALDSRKQIMLSLRTVANSHGVSKPTLSRILHRFVAAVSDHLYPTIVDWPEDVEQLNGIANEFKTRRGMPCAFSCVDGSLIDIVAPSVDEAQFVDRHQRHSLNAMFVCGPKLKFYYVSSKWPGSVHDARVFRNSSLKRRLDTGWHPIQQGVLLGDSAYADCDYLVTTVTDPQTQSERYYNRAHRRTRNLIECAIGILKQRFWCLLHIMHLKPVFAAEVIRCCAALHNLLMPEDEAAEALEEFDREHDAIDEHDYHGGGIQLDGDMTRKRQLIALF